jgi:hypothetical protein
MRSNVQYKGPSLIQPLLSTKPRILASKAREHILSMPSMFTAITSSILAFRAAATNVSKSSRRLEKDLASAERAQQPPDVKFWNNHEYQQLMHNTFGKHVVDGIHICCHCGAENDIIHFKGDHPFKHLTCHECDHTYCHKCTSSEILTHINPAYLLFQGQSVVQHSHRIGQICSNCGLTHRTILRKDDTISLDVKCACGTRSNEKWVAFVICSPDRFRWDPNAAAVQLKIRRAVRNVEQLARPEPVPVLKASHPFLEQICKPVEISCELRRQNAVCGRGRRVGWGERSVCISPT